jgi:pimeloyl-ACP methyl ester carboxylesterase
MRKGLRITLIALIALLIIAAAGFVIWGKTPARPMPEAILALQSDAEVKVTDGKWLTFEPVSTKPTTGLIFYPGGRVDYRAYAPAAHQIARGGFLVTIVPMPLSLAVLDPSAAKEVIAAYPDIQQWVVGGHSLGGAMAANFARNYGLAQGLVLWAAYPASGDDLSGSGLRAVSIYGTRDGLATGGKIEASKALLQPSTRYVAIEGGNHAQFGWYGEQAGDNPAAIDRASQQAQAVESTLALLRSLQ